MTNKELFERYRSDVYRTCYYMLGQAADAEDLCQDVFMTAFRSNWNSINNVKAWLLRIAVNQCLNLLRRRNNLRTKLTQHSQRFIGKAEQTPEEHVQQQEGIDEWAGYLLQLPIKIRTVISLRYVHDLNTTEIAELLNIPEGTVRSRQHKGLKSLRTMLEKSDVTIPIVKGGTYDYQTRKG